MRYEKVLKVSRAGGIFFFLSCTFFLREDLGGT